MEQNLPLQFKQQDDLAPFPEFALGAAFIIVPMLLVDTPSLASQGQPLRGFLASSIVFLVSLAAFRLSPVFMVLLIATGAGIHLATVEQPTFTLAIWPWAAYIISRWSPLAARISVLVFDGLFACVGGWCWAPWVGRAYGISPVVGGLVAGGLCFGITVFAFLIGQHVSNNAKINAKVLWGLWDAQQEFDNQLREERLLASAATRLEISRELHDILGHSLAVVVRQADGGGALGKKNPAAAIKALHTISTVGREALREIRNVIGELRSSDDPESMEWGPQPDLAQIQTLVDRAGDRVELRVNGEPYHVPPIVGVTAYRVAQEALTNFFKHAHAEAHAVVQIDYNLESIQVDVSNTGEPDSAANYDQGNGIRGMSERVSALHGEFTCGPLPAGGYVVHAKLPVSSPVAPP